MIRIVIDDEADRTVIVIDHENLPAFLELLRRGTNTWQQMPQEIRELKDALLPPAEWIPITSGPHAGDRYRVVYETAGNQSVRELNDQL